MHKQVSRNIDINNHRAIVSYVAKSEDEITSLPLNIDALIDRDFKICLEDNTTPTQEEDVLVIVLDNLEGIDAQTNMLVDVLKPETDKNPDLYRKSVKRFPEAYMLIDDLNITDPEIENLRATSTFRSKRHSR